MVTSSKSVDLLGTWVWPHRQSVLPTYIWICWADHGSVSPDDRNDRYSFWTHPLPYLPFFSATMETVLNRELTCVFKQPNSPLFISPPGIFFGQRPWAFSAGCSAETDNDRLPRWPLGKSPLGLCQSLFRSPQAHAHVFLVAAMEELKHHISLEWGGI